MTRPNPFVGMIFYGVKHQDWWEIIEEGKKVPLHVPNAREH